MKKSNKNQNIKNKIQKVATRFLENVVGGKGENKEHLDNTDNNQLLADIDIDNVDESKNQEISKV